MLKVKKESKGGTEEPLILSNGKESDQPKVRKWNRD